MKYLDFIYVFVLLAFVSVSVVYGRRSRNDIIDVNGGKACAGERIFLYEILLYLFNMLIFKKKKDFTIET